MTTKEWPTRRLKAYSEGQQNRAPLWQPSWGKAKLVGAAWGLSIVGLIPEKEKPVSPRISSYLPAGLFFLSAVDFPFGQDTAYAFPQAQCLMFLAFSYLYLYVGQKCTISYEYLAYLVEYGFQRYYA